MRSICDGREEVGRCSSSASTKQENIINFCSFLFSFVAEPFVIDDEGKGAAGLRYGGTGSIFGTSSFCVFDVYYILA